MWKLLLRAHNCSYMYNVQSTQRDSRLSAVRGVWLLHFESYGKNMRSAHVILNANLHMVLFSIDHEFFFLFLSL